MKPGSELLKGNYGEAFIFYKLSKYCLVRPVSAGTDIGIDLYCELLDKDESPSIHFWLQVKHGGTDYIKILKNDKVSFSFKKSQLEYWAQQPVPVFVILIPESYIISENTYVIFIINMTDKLLDENILKINSRTKSIKSDYRVSNDEEFKRIIYSLVDITTARMKLKDGIICPTPSTNKRYLKSYYPQNSYLFSDKILHSIRSTSAFILGDILKNSDKIHKHEEYRQVFTKILESFLHKRSWEVHFYYALSKFYENELVIANEHFIESKKIIEDDPIINQDDWAEIKVEIEKYIQRTIVNDIH